MPKTSFHCPRCKCFSLHWYGIGIDRHAKCFGCGYDSREDDQDEDSRGDRRERMEVILDRLEARCD